jgi:hypothetical protein
VVALLERLGVEERGHPRHRQRVVMDGDREVLVVGGQLVADLVVELLGEARGGHATDPRGAGGGPAQAALTSFFFVTFLPSTRTSLRFLTV